MIMNVVITVDTMFSNVTFVPKALMRQRLSTVIGDLVGNSERRNFHLLTSHLR